MFRSGFSRFYLIPLLGLFALIGGAAQADDRMLTLVYCKMPAVVNGAPGDYTVLVEASESYALKKTVSLTVETPNPLDEPYAGEIVGVRSSSYTAGDFVEYSGRGLTLRVDLTRELAPGSGRFAATLQADVIESGKKIELPYCELPRGESAVSDDFVGEDEQEAGTVAPEEPSPESDRLPVIQGAVWL